VASDVRPLDDTRHLFLKRAEADSLAVEGDAVKVRRIAENLLPNALKYIVAGGVTVSWRGRG
jgi:signal transduction histidine kinase